MEADSPRPSVPQASPARPRAKTRKTQGVNALERALAILDAFIGVGPRALAELSRATMLAKPTVLRALVSLERAGYVVRLSDGNYQLGAKLLQLGATYRSNFRLEQYVLPALEDLAQATQESAAFHIREGNCRLCLFRVESPQIVRDVQKPAALVPLDATSTGRVLETATWPCQAEDGRTLVYASSGVYDVQTASISTAVFGTDKALMGALTVSGPIGRFGSADVRSMAHELVEAARRLSTILGSPLPSCASPARIVRL